MGQTIGAKAPKSTSSGTNPTTVVSSNTPIHPSPQDTRLLTYVRQNIAPICGGLITLSATRANDKDWAGMSEYAEMANQLGSLGGLEQVGAPNVSASGSNRVAAAGAGSR